LADYSLEQFQKSCAIREPLHLRVTRRDRPSETFDRVIDHPFAIVGRHANADILLEHPDVSRRHAYIQVIGGRLFCVDLESRTGVRWQGTPRPAGWIEVGDLIEIGPFQIESLNVPHAGFSGLSVPVAPAEPLESWPPEVGTAPVVALEVVNRAGGSVSLAVNRCLSLLGTASACKPRLAHESVSRFQCSLLQTPQGVWVVDLFGRGGVQVQRVHVRFARLDHGDELRLGRYVFRLFYGFFTPGVMPTARFPSGELPEHPPFVTEGPPVAFSTLAVPSMSTSLGSIVGSPSTPAELADPRLLPLIQHFGQLQQHMFDQFQQSMMMLLQLFGSLHRDQMATIQEELGRIRELSQQLSAIQASPDQQPSAGGIGGRETVEGLPSAAFPNPPSGTRGDGMPRENASFAMEWQRPIPARGATPTLPVDEQAGDREPATSHRDRAATNAERRRPTDEEVHSVLSQRIAAIQNERQSRWQRILNLVTGN